jgi:hypothetical protein
MFNNSVFQLHQSRSTGFYSDRISFSASVGAWVCQGVWVVEKSGAMACSVWGQSGLMAPLLCLLRI